MIRLSHALCLHFCASYVSERERERRGGKRERGDGRRESPVMLTRGKRGSVYLGVGNGTGGGIYSIKNRVGEGRGYGQIEWREGEKQVN